MSNEKDLTPKDTKDNHIQLRWGVALNVSGIYGNQKIYTVVQLQQGTDADPCAITAKSAGSALTAAMVTENIKCTSNDQLVSDPTKINELGYDAFFWLSDYSRKVDVSQIKNSLPVIWMDPVLYADQVKFLTKNKWIQITYDYPKSAKNDAEIGFRYNLHDTGASKTLSLIKGGMNEIPRNTHLRALPNLWTKSMISAYYTAKGKSVPTCAHEQAYYTSPECDKLTDLDLEKFTVNEYIKQYCHAHIDSQGFLDYMEKFYSQCGENDPSTPLKFYYCSENLREELPLAKRINDCFNMSYNDEVDKTLQPEKLKNNLLESTLSYVQTIWKTDDVTSTS